MIEVTRLLAAWLAKHNIPSDGMEIVIEMPSVVLADRVEQAIEHDLSPMEAFQKTTFSRRAKIETMNGLKLTISHR